MPILYYIVGYTTDYNNFVNSKINYTTLVITKINTILKVYSITSFIYTT